MSQKAGRTVAVAVAAASEMPNFLARAFCFSPSAAAMVALSSACAGSASAAAATAAGAASAASAATGLQTIGFLVCKHKQSMCFSFCKIHALAL